jgi:hypothetical protein
MTSSLPWLKASSGMRAANALFFSDVYQVLPRC